MTNKEIIVDGVDVSECKYFNCEPYTEPYCENSDGEDLDCQSYPNCYYKQLKRKEQECEEKDESIRYFKKCLDNSFKRQTDNELWWEKERNKLTQKLKEKEQECEEQNKVIKAQREENNLNIYKLGEMVKKNGDLYEEKQKYKQALDEIEKYCTQNKRSGWVDVEGVIDIINKAKECQ